MSDHVSESTILNRVMLALTNIGCRVFRNHTGLGWQGEVHRFMKHQQIYVVPGDVLVRNARPLKAGLCNGGSDCIGWRSVEITADMVGKRVAVFVAIETKSEVGTLTHEQRNFIHEVQKSGGIAGCVFDADLVVKDVEEWKP